MKSKVYLGDGVYAQTTEGVPYDTLVLTTETGTSVSNTIYLDPHVIDALLIYMRAKELIIDHQI